MPGTQFPGTDGRVLHTRVCPSYSKKLPFTNGYSIPAESYKTVTNQERQKIIYIYIYIYIYTIIGKNMYGITHYINKGRGGR